VDCFSDAKDLGEIPIDLSSTEAPNGSLKSTFLTNILLYVRNGARLGHSYY